MSIYRVIKNIWTTYKATVVESTLSSAVGTGLIIGGISITDQMREDKPIDFETVGKDAGAGALLGAAVGATYPISIPGLCLYAVYKLKQYSDKHK